MNNQQWQTLTPFDIPSFDQVEAILHRAAQFLAMVGKNFLPHQDDDSHANLGWSADNQTMLTWPLPESGLQAAFHIPSFQLQLRNGENRILNHFDLQGATKTTAFDWLRQALSEQGLSAGKLQYISHYEVPEHPVDKGAVFEKPATLLLESWMAARSNANVVLQQLTSLFESPSDVRIWPHHFDTGIYHALDGKGIGMGWAISDSMFHEPYFYTYAWSPDQPIDYPSFPAPNHGGWHIKPDGWNGAYLRASDIFKETDGPTQQEMAMQFLKETTNSLLQAMNMELRV